MFEGGFRQILRREVDAIPLPPEDKWVPAVVSAGFGARTLIIGAACTLAILLGVVTISIAGLLSRPATQQSASEAVPASSPTSRPSPFALRAGAIDPIAVAVKPSDQTFPQVQLAASAAPVTIRFINGVPQSVTVLDESSGTDLYHVTSGIGPGHPQVDQGFVQVFLAGLHNDGSQQLVLAFGSCRPSCAGASQVLVISMNAEHHVVIEQVRLDGLKDAVTEVRDGSLWVSQWDNGRATSVREFRWDPARQEMVER